MKKSHVYNLGEVFTVVVPASLTFIERNSVNKRLNRAIITQGKQVVIYGFSGAGKTTLLTNKLKTDKIKHITTRCVTGMSINDIIIDAFNQLEVFYVNQKENIETDKVGGTLSASYFGLKASIASEISGNIKSSSKRAVELAITPQTLARFIGASDNCWILEDFHKIDFNEKKLFSQIMKVFMDSSSEFPNIKIIAIGAVNSAREVVEFDPEMKNRISEIEVPLMNESELEDILKIGEKLLNIKLPERIISKIVAYSSGLPAVTHQLAYLLCEVNGIKKTHNSIKALDIKINTFDEALDEYLAENSDSLKATFESSTKILHKRKSENPAEILKAILSCNKEYVTVNDIIEVIKISDKNYKGNNLKKYVDEFIQPLRSEILRFNKDSMSYYFSNPFVKAYFQCVLRNDIGNEIINNKVLLKDFRDTLDKELEIARGIFLKDLKENEEFDTFFYSEDLD